MREEDRLLQALDSEAPPGGDVSLGRDALHILLEQLYPGRRGLHDDLEIVVLQSVAGVVPVDVYALRVGQWRVDLPRRAFQTVLATAILTGTIAVAGPTGVPVAVVAAVLPFLVEIDRVEVRTRDRIVLAALRRGRLDAEPTIKELYARLPVDLQGQLTLLEFADVHDRLQAAGLTEPAVALGVGESISGDPASREIVIVLPDCD